MKLVIATRKSALALWQSEFIKSELLERFPDLEITLNKMVSKGDILIDTPLAKIGGKGLFTKELETSMLEGKSDIAIHSLKDVPFTFPKGLELVGIPPRADRRDAFLSQKYKNIQDLPKNAIVGTTSLRRRMQLLALRDDLIIKNLRGNINTRISKLKNKEYDAIILAKAGLDRLELGNIVKYIIPIEVKEMIPSASQAILGIETTSNQKIKNIVKSLNDENALIESTVERDFSATLDGGCQVPIGVTSFVKGENIEVEACIGYPDGTKIMRKKKTFQKDNYKTAGIEMANLFLKDGAKELLKDALKMAEDII